MSSLMAPMIETLSSIELADIPISFSFSKHLAGVAQDKAQHISNLQIVLNSEILDQVHYIVLGLTEECRDLQRGGFYHLPLRQDLDFGHPCDLIFIDEDWSDYDCQQWDKKNWEERLELLATAKKIQGQEVVIPICARILAHDYRHESQDDQEFVGKPSRAEKELEDLSKDDKGAIAETSIKLSELSISSPTNANSSARSDPATVTGTSIYSRPTEDISTFLVHYDDFGSRTFVCLCAAAEHRSLCQRRPTPGHVSETFKRNEDLVKLHSSADIELNTMAAAEIARAAQLVLDGNASSTLDVVVRIFRAWNEHDLPAVNDQKFFGRIKFLWDELDNRIATDRSFRDVSLMKFWPRA